MCGFIGRILDTTTFLGKRHFHRLVQIDGDYSVCEHPVAAAWTEADSSLDAADLEQLGLMVLAVRAVSGEVINSFLSTGDLKPGDTLLQYGRDSGHEALENKSSSGEANLQKAADAH